LSDVRNPPSAGEDEQGSFARAVATVTDRVIAPAVANASTATREDVMSGPPQTLRDYAGAWVKQVRGGDSGVLPVVIGLIILVIVFQTQSSVFLSAGNLTNLVAQGAVFILLGMAEVFVLLLGEIDLSTGFNAGVGAAITVQLIAYPHSYPWWVACLAGIAGSSLLGAVQGFIITRLGIPSFVVTLAGFLGFEGLMIIIVDSGNSSGTIPLQSNIVNDIVQGNLSPAAGWIVMIVAVVAYGAFAVLRDRRRRATGLSAAPLSLTLVKVGAVAVAGVAVVLIGNTNRGLLASSSLRGVPWVVLLILAVLAGYTFVLGRTRFGRYLYAIGGNAEAARRAGVNLKRIRMSAFLLSGFTAGIAGIVYASRLGSMSTDLDGGTIVLYAVASAVIGGTSLFGGRGKMVHALLGGLVIATIYNGLGLLAPSAAVQYIVTALVLLVAVTVDSVARRNRTAVR